MRRGGGILRDVPNSIGRSRFSGTVSALFRNLCDAEVLTEFFFLNNWRGEMVQRKSWVGRKDDPTPCDMSGSRAEI
jgi:hypothetical protein